MMSNEIRPRILVVDGSLGGSAGNSAAVSQGLVQELAKRGIVRRVYLAEEGISAERIAGWLASSDGFLFCTGTYWDSWGSPLQEFMEAMTEFEAGDLVLGKPVGALVTMHSVGGKGVLSRLQGVLSTMGFLIPPMSGMVYSLAAHLALQTEDTGFHGDFWRPVDFEVIAHNLTEAARGGREWMPWPVDSGDPRRRWF